jgi:hypothetical protein
MSRHPYLQVRGEVGVGVPRLVLRQEALLRRQRQAVMAPGGLPLWTGPAEPASARERHRRRPHPLHAPPCTAPPPEACRPGRQRLPGRRRRHPHPRQEPPAGKGTASRELDADQRARNLLLGGLPCQGERGFALLTRRWAAIRHITASPAEPPETTQRRPRPDPVGNANT